MIPTCHLRSLRLVISPQRFSYYNQVASTLAAVLITKKDTLEVLDVGNCDDVTHDGCILLLLLFILTPCQI
jgi:hypothetical protein